MDWVTEGDLKRCTRHDITFDRIDVCPKCISDPGPEIDQAQPDDEDPAALADEQWFRTKAEELWGFVEAMTTSKGDLPSRARIEYSTIAKVADTACKFMRAAVDERRRRDEHKHDRWLVKQCRELARRGVAN